MTGVACAHSLHVKLGRSKRMSIGDADTGRDRRDASVAMKPANGSKIEKKPEFK